MEMHEKTVFGVIGIFLMALIGWVIGALLEHPGPGGLQFLGALIGVLIALAVLSLGEAIKHKK